MSVHALTITGTTILCQTEARLTFTQVGASSVDTSLVTLVVLHVIHWQQTLIHIWWEKHSMAHRNQMRGIVWTYAYWQEKTMSFFTPSSAYSRAKKT